MSAAKAFQHQLARHTQGAGQVSPALLQALHQGDDAVGIGRTGWQEGQFSGVAAAHALQNGAVCAPGGGGGGGQRGVFGHVGRAAQKAQGSGSLQIVGLPSSADAGRRRAG